MSVLELRGWEETELSPHSTRRRGCLRQAVEAPVVNISGTLQNTPVPRVSLDNRLVGKLAAEHLIERGFVTFAYYGLRDVAYSKVRHDVRGAVAEAGMRIVRIAVDAADLSGQRSAVARPAAQLVKWLSALADAGRLACRD